MMKKLVNMMNGQLDITSTNLECGVLSRSTGRLNAERNEQVGQYAVKNWRCQGIAWKIISGFKDGGGGQ